MPAPETITQLVQRFAANLDSYKAGNYNEAQLRQEFINPFFKALGWDMVNEQGIAEAYKEVIHEDAIKIGSATKAPDYCFRVGRERKFFVEAKKPFVNVKDDINPAFQLRRYAWSAKLPLSILTDFEEFAVYDCRIRPTKTDKASTGRIHYFTFTDYEKHWDEIAGVFSKAAVLKGSFDKYAESNKGKKGTAAVDDAFLKEIENWRELLAKNIALRNTNLSQRELNFAIQRTIDRIIFLRICEDRGIENYGSLMQHLNGERVYRRLCKLFRDADDKYNSGIFHFQKEKERPEEPDELTLNLEIDDKPLKEIIKNLYYPESPYEFSVLSADILGQVYEQFLGKVIRLTAGHQAKVEDKPEVKKAGGVYYTPTYIVDYIVKNTVGKLLEGKTPKEVAKLRILDPACGSGSFLIGAYQFLLDWHLDWYVQNDPTKWSAGKNPALYLAHCPSPCGEGGLRTGVGEVRSYRLTTPERKRILLNNIFGVDIDTQAVEVTKLSLLLKVLEGENEQSIAQQLKLFHERALPDLGSNIKCGNSLIGSDFYEGKPVSLFEDEEKYRINAFDWDGKGGFPEIMKAGGFDAVIGNPPYIRIQAMKEWAPKEVEFYKEKYRAASAGNYDIYVVFVEKALGLLGKNGMVGYILPHKFFNSQYGTALRSIISEKKNLTHIVHFGSEQVFVGATTYTCLLFLSANRTKACHLVQVDDLTAWHDNSQTKEGMISNSSITSAEWNFVIGSASGLFEKLNRIGKGLGDIADIFVGLQTSADDVFIMDAVAETTRSLRLRSRITEEEYDFERGLFYPLVSGTDVKRYRQLPERQFVLFPYKVDNGQVRVIDFENITQQYPRTASYLLAHKKRLEEREKGKVRGPKWHGYIYLKNMALQSVEKLCVPRLVEYLCATYDVGGRHYLDNVDVGGVALKDEYRAQNLSYLLGLLNSRLLRWYFPFVSAPFRGGWMSANRQFLAQLPIKVVALTDPRGSARHGRVVELVNSMLDLHKQLPAAKTEHEKTVLQRQIDATDRQIDALVYELYGLTEEEIKIVEGENEKK